MLCCDQVPSPTAAVLRMSQVLPYRPEPWVTLAKLYRMEKTDQPKCYAYAAGALAQGKPRPDALFLSTNVSKGDCLPPHAGNRSALVLIVLSAR